MTSDYGEREVTPEDRDRAVLHDLIHSRSNVRITEGMVRGLREPPTWLMPDPNPFPRFRLFCRHRHVWKLDAPGWVCETCGTETLMPEGFPPLQDTQRRRRPHPVTHSPDELRKLYEIYVNHDPGWVEAETTLVLAVPSLLDELDRRKRNEQRDGDSIDDLAAHLHRKQRQLDQARRELEELRSAARSAADDIDRGRHFNALATLATAENRLAVVSTQETDE